MSTMPYIDKIKKGENHKKYMREVWYPKNRKKHISYVNNVKNNRLFGNVFLEYPEVLDFDHINNDKKFNISEFKSHTLGFNVVKKEIKKCEIVCSNCHRIRTANRKRLKH